MIKKVSKFFLYTIMILILIGLYLSFYGVSTKIFNNKIKSEVLKINKGINLEIKSVKILLDLSNLSANIQTFGPVILFNGYKLRLNHIKTNISLKSLINQKISIDDLQISTQDIEIKQAVSLAKSIKNSTELYILGKVIKGGFLESNININFDSDGKIKKDYQINGFIKNLKLNLLSKQNIDNLNLTFSVKDKELSLKDVETDINQIKLFSQYIKITEKNKSYFIDGKIRNITEDISLKLLNNLFQNLSKKLNTDKVNIRSENIFSINIDKKFRIKNFDLKSDIDLKELDYKINSTIFKKYFPNLKDSVIFKNHKIQVEYNKKKLRVKGRGGFSIDNNLDFINYNLNKKNNDYIFDADIKIKDNLFLVEELDYTKKEKVKGLLKVSGIFKKNNNLSLDLISFTENDNYFKIKNLDLNNQFKIRGMESLKINLTNNMKFKNEIYLKKDKKNYILYGKSYDASKLIDKLLFDDSQGGLSKILDNFNSNIDIKIEKIYLDEKNIVNNINGKLILNKSEIEYLNLVSYFKKNKKLSISIINKDGEKFTTLFSDYAYPLVKKYNFIKGFEEGVLNFSSVKKNNVSNSTLTIYDFKLQELPALTKLLTLASLQGIADLLTGEGIRFDEFEMNFSNKRNLMTIEEIYSIGPAISILMDGYLEADKLVSLRGTLVPATTINKAIGSIPLLGNILVGKKAGEGVFGVSFKIKGAPNDLKTSVNPIKTLTPRFITRTLEKINKN